MVKNFNDLEHKNNLVRRNKKNRSINILDNLSKIDESSSVIVMLPEKVM